MTTHKTKFLIIDNDSCENVKFFDELKDVKEYVTNCYDESSYSCDNDTILRSSDLDLRLFRLPPGQKGKEFELEIWTSVNVKEVPLGNTTD